MSAWDRLAPHFTASNEDMPLQRVGLAVLGRGLFASRYKNLLLVGLRPEGLILRIQAPSVLSFFSGTKTLFIPWAQVGSAPPPGFSFAPQETWLLGPEQIPLTVARGTIQMPRW